MTDWIGWLATAVFALSYLSVSSTTLRRVQALAAILWIIYGISARAAPVVVANTVVACMAAFSARRKMVGNPPADRASLMAPKQSGKHQS